MASSSMFSRLPSAHISRRRIITQGFHIRLSSSNSSTEPSPLQCRRVHSHPASAATSRQAQKRHHDPESTNASSPKGESSSHSQTESNVSPIQSDLPKSSLRSLFALHHAAQHFITPETLDSAIETAFATSNTMAATSFSQRFERGLQDLENHVKTLRGQDSWAYLQKEGEEAPFIGDTKSDRYSYTVGVRKASLPNYSAMPEGAGTITAPRIMMEKLQAREMAVKAALYGVEPDGTQFYPGLDVIEDELEPAVSLADEVDGAEPGVQNGQDKAVTA
ncbi:hypothetical protein FRB99_002337 [Tulasnella sp. 403]|nr:hypothetical protein FRB99_002337 [Tulasnella sp. 403]